MTTSNTRNKTADKVRSLYDQVVVATHSAAQVPETQTVIIQPGTSPATQPPTKPKSKPKLIRKLPDGSIQRIDQPHEEVVQSHTSMRLKKFMELSKRYAKPEPSPAPPSSQPAQPTNQPSSWQQESGHKVVGYRLHPNQAVTNRPTQEASITKPAQRIDAKQATPAPHFTSSLQPQSTGWETDVIHWPNVTSELISDSSLAIDKLGNNAIKLMSGQQNQLLLTSTTRREGVTTLAICIARWANSTGKQVLLVDGDIGRAGLSQSLGINQRITWTTAVNDLSRIPQSLIRCKTTGLFVLPLASIADRSNLPSNLYDSLGDVIAAIGDCFDLVVIDGGPTNQIVQETSKLHLLADSTLLVTDISQAHNYDISETKSTLVSYGVGKMIVAENFLPNHTA